MKSSRTCVVSAVVLLSVLLAGCANASNNKKWINSNLDGNLLNEKPSLKDDFYQSLNYETLKMPLSGSEEPGTTENNDDFTNPFVSQIASMAATSGVESLENPGNQTLSEKQKLIAIYNMGMDWERRNELGLQPILPTLKKIQSVKSIEQLNSIFEDDNIRLFFPIKIDRKAKVGSLYYSPKISLIYVISDDYDLYFDFYMTMLQRVGYSQEKAEELLKSANELEKRYNLNLVKEKGTGKNLYFGQLKDSYKNFPITEYLESNELAGLNFGFTPDFEIFDSLYVDENLEAVKTLCLCRLFSASACLLDREALDCYLKLNEKITGLKRNFTNEDLVVLFLNEYIPNYLGKVWCEEYCSEEIIADVEKLCNDILSNYKKEISSWEWLSTASRYTLVELLNKTKVIAGHSSFYDYSDLQLKDNLFDSILEVAKLEKRIQSKNCFKDPDVYEWSWAPQVNNAYYNPSNNSVNILAGYIFLSRIKYDVNDSYEKKLSGLGCTMAHEISHLFSSPSDEEGVLLQIIGTTDHKEIEKRIVSVSDYFSSCEIFDGVNCDGTKCRTEIGADVFGMSAILKTAAAVPGFDYKLFFEYYAKNNASKSTEKLLKNQHETDPHPLDFLRVNAVVQQFDEFYEAFGIKRGDGMYLAPEKRFKL